MWPLVVLFLFGWVSKKKTKLVQPGCIRFELYFRDPNPPQHIDEEKDVEEDDGNEDVEAERKAEAKAEDDTKEESSSKSNALVCFFF